MRGWRSRRAPRWSPIRFARRSALGHRRGQTLALVAVSALITACTAFAPVYDRAMQQALVDTLLAHASTAEKTVTVQSEADGRRGRRDGGARPPRPPGDGPPRRGRTARTTCAGPHRESSPRSSATSRRPGHSSGETAPASTLRVLSGTCPGAPGEILVSEADVENFGLSLGSTPTVDAGGGRADGVRLEVVGTYAPRDAPWWQGLKLVGISSVSHGPDPSAAHDAWLTTEETFVDGPILPGETSQAGALVRTAYDRRRRGARAR